MAKIIDKKQSKPRMANTSHCFVWVVTTQNEEGFDEQVGVFYDPWKACEWAIRNYGCMCTIEMSIYKTDWCK